MQFNVVSLITNVYEGGTHNSIALPHFASLAEEMILKIIIARS
jgi:hypothetical protein